MKKHEMRVAWLVAAVSLVGALVGCGGSPAIVPTSYQTFKGKDDAFQLEVPVGWEQSGGGVPGRAWAKFKSGSAEIGVDADVMGSVMADIASPHGQIQEKDPTREAVHKVHVGEKDGFEEKEGVKEGEPSVIKTAMTDGRRSEFTGAPTFGAATHGYRATVLSVDRRIRIICKCSESQWATLKPVFDKVIASVKK
jgi:hypothetical protein